MASLTLDIGERVDVTPMGDYISLDVFGGNAEFVTTDAVGARVSLSDGYGRVVLSLSPGQADVLIAMLRAARRMPVTLTDTTGGDFEVPMSVYARGRRPAPSHLAHLYDED